MSFAAVKVSASGERGEDCRSKVSRRAGSGGAAAAAAAAAAVTMPRRKQTQPMQRKYSDDSKESDDRLSEADPDDLTEEQGLRTDFEGAREGGDCNDTFGGYQNLCFSADDPEAVDSLKGTDFYASNLEAPERHLRVAADGEVRSGSEHRRSAVNSDGYLVPESHACSPPPRPVKRNEYPDGFRGDDHRRRLPETGRTEVEIERENFRRLNGGEEASAEMTERSLKRDYSSTNDVVQVKKERLSFGGVGRESGGDRSSSCPVLSSGTFSGKEPSSSTSPTAAISSAAPGGRTAMMESAGLGFAVVLASDSGSSRLQSSVKQLESFVASVECHGGGGGGARSAPTNPERKGVPGSAALSTPPRVPGVAVVAAAAAAEQPRKSKGYSSRLKSHSTALPKLAKQQQQQQQHGGQTGFLDSARCFLAASHQSCGDPNQPLDLSVKTRPRDTAKYLSYSGSHDFFPSCSSSSSPSSSSAVGGGTSGSSLADLEKKFGNASAIFDRIGTKTWASPFCGALVSRLGMNLYNSKLPFGDAAAAVGPGAFGPLGMIPVPVQRFNSTAAAAAAAATPVKSDVVPPTVKSGGRADDQEPPSGGPRSSTGGPPDPGFPWHAQHQKHAAPTAAAAADAPTDSHRKHTVFQCSCGAELDTLYHLTMHLQQTGHAPNRSKNVGRQEYSKLVRGQDMWLNHGCEQTRQILRCMECDESFKSLPELTVHMIKTKHYANIVGTDALQKKATVAPPSSSSLRAGETRSEPSTEEEEEEEEEEEDEDEEEEDEASSRVHCLVCLEAFDNPESLGAHIVEVGHYKDFTTAAGSERRGSTAESASSPVKDPLGDQSGPRGFPNSRAVGEPISVGRSSPGAAKNPAVDSLDRLPYPAAESNDRKRYCSVSESSAGDEVKEAETAAIIGERTPRRSDGDEIPTKYKRLGGETTERPSFVEAKSPSFVAKDRRRSSQREEDRSPSGETNLNASYFPQRRHRVFSGNKKDADNFSGRRREGEKEEDEEAGEEEEEVMEDRVESNADSSAFQADNFFRPSSSSSTNCSSDGYAIRAMETFIKKSFGSAETKHRLPATSLVGSPATQVGCYDPLGQPAAAAGQQELKATEALETTSRSLYQNKYLPPVYITTPPRDDRRPDREGVLPGVSPPFLPTARKIKTETGVERSPKGQSSEKFGNGRESPNRESEAATTKEADRPGSTDRKAGKANRRSRQWSQRQGDTRQRRMSPEYGGKTDCDSVKSESFLSNVNSNRTVDPHQQSVEMMKMELSDAESEEPLSSTSNNNNNLFRSSALESLQGLVYGKALNTEHPLDSLQKLIYGRGGSTPAGVAPRASGHLLNGANGSHAGAAVIMKDSDSLHHHHHPHHHLHHSLPPGTLILVNPIVTVVPGASGSTPSLNITLPGTGDPSAMARVVDDCSSGGGGGGGRASDLGGGAARRNRSPGAAAAAAEDNDDRENSLLRVYRCSGCRRRFSSKGSYRYHLSRCHVLTSSSSSTTAAAADKVPAAPSSIKDPLRKSPFVCMPLDVTAKFNKYYQLASELGTEAK